MNQANDLTYSGTKDPEIPGRKEVLVRYPDGEVKALPHWVRHSHDGFQWGYGGSGPADLALCLLIHHFRATGQPDPTEAADRLYQRFKWAVIAKLEPHWALTTSQIDRLICAVESSVDAR